MPDAHPLQPLTPYAFVLAVNDMDKSATYFRDALGFRLDWADSSDWRLMVRGGMRVMLGHCPDTVPVSQTGDHSYFGYLEVADVDALHAEFVRQGALILSPPTDRPYLMREMTVATPDGHRFVVGHSLGQISAGE